MKQKSIKLILINFLSDPELKILDWSLENEIETVSHELNCNPWQWDEKKLTGRKYLKLTLIKDDNSGTTE